MSSSSVVFSSEQEHFFDRSWVCVGRSEGLAEAGDQHAVPLGWDSVLLVRGEDDTLRAFYNVCRNRGHELLRWAARPAAGSFAARTTPGPTGSTASSGAAGLRQSRQLREERVSARLDARRGVARLAVRQRQRRRPPRSMSTPVTSGRTSRTTAARSSS